MSDPNSLEDQQYVEMGKIYEQIVKNPATREVALRATKHVSPSTPIPEIDLIDRVAKGVQPLNEKIATLEKEKLEREVKDRIEAKRADLREAGHSKSDIDAIEKLMVERNIPDHKTAAEFFTLQSRQVAPSSPHLYTSPTKIPFGDKDAVKAAGGQRKFFIQDAHQAVDDIRSGKIKLQ